MQLARYICFVLAITCMGLAAVAQNDAVKKNNGGGKPKKVTTYHYKKLKASEGFMVDGKKEGTWMYWYPSGEIKQIENYKNFKLDGSVGTFAPVLPYDSIDYGVMKGLYKMRLKAQKNNAVGPKLHLIHYKNGLKEGSSLTWHDSVLIMQSAYVRDTLDGEYKEYRLTKPGEKQVLRKMVTYKMGVYHGKYIDYTQGEQYVTEGHYVNGKKDGAWKEFENAVFYENNYVNGKLHGKQTIRDIARKPLGEKEYRNGILHGPFTEYNYDEPGIVMKTTGTHAEGEKTGLMRVYRNNTLYSEYGAYTGVLNGPHRTYYGNGKLKTEGEYVFGMINGCWTHYTSQGIKEGTECFDHGEMVSFDYFHLNGKKAATSVRDKNGIHRFTEFYPSGKKRMEILKFRNDQPIDYILTTWNEKGKKNEL